MKIFIACVASLTLWACNGVATEDPLRSSPIRSNEVVPDLSAREARDWVYPQELSPMPQCIAQQDPSSWLTIMTESTENICTRHFMFWCTRRERRTQLDRLSLGFTSDAVVGYFPYCSRSILAKAQLYNWISGISGRTWLVEVGDANDVQKVSPASLARGYAASGVTQQAPKCLTESVSRDSGELFHQVMASCSFTGRTRHTGMVDRPWEYREDRRSMTALDVETVGYDLTQRYIKDDNYFDRECLCNNFAFNHDTRYCGGPGHLDWTRNQLWINATCGPSFLPQNWTDSLLMLGPAYISTKAWSWPVCVADMPKHVREHADICAVIACEHDSLGYCNFKPAVDRACFCRSIDYDSCKGSCHIFEGRIDYVMWLHKLCSDVPDWHGLPDDWHHLAAPTILDMLPWDWTIGPPPSVGNGSITNDPVEQCVSNDQKIGTLFIVHIITCLAAFYMRRVQVRHVAYRLGWLESGLSLLALQLGANCLNAMIVQQTSGYENIPISNLVLLWCSMPRLSWLLFVLVGLLPQGGMNLSAARSFLFAEVTLQAVSLYYMISTVVYGLSHSFYFGSLNLVDNTQSAKFMYFGALAWLVIIVVTVFWLIQSSSGRMNDVTEDHYYPAGFQKRKQASKSLGRSLFKNVDGVFVWLGDKLERHWMNNTDMPGEHTPLIGRNCHSKTIYGTLEGYVTLESRRNLAKQYAIAGTIMFLLWVSQWVFWLGFIGLSSDEFCLPRLGLLTAIWIIASLVGTFIGAAR